MSVMITLSFLIVSGRLFADLLLLASQGRMRYEARGDNRCIRAGFRDRRVDRGSQ